MTASTDGTRDLLRRTDSHATDSSATAPKPRVLIVYPHLPHYRSEVFAALELSASIEWSFAADLQSVDRTIPTVPPDEILRFHRLRNHWQGPALWQSRLLRVLLTERSDAVIFMGDAAHLSTWIGASICRLRGQKVLYWTIGWHRPEQGIRRVARLRFYRIAHMLLLYGNTARRHWRASGVSGESTLRHRQQQIVAPRPRGGSEPRRGLAAICRQRGRDGGGAVEQQQETGSDDPGAIDVEC